MLKFSARDGEDAVKFDDLIAEIDQLDAEEADEIIDWQLAQSPAAMNEQGGRRQPGDHDLTWSPRTARVAELAQELASYSEVREPYVGRCIEREVTVAGGPPALTNERHAGHGRFSAGLADSTKDLASWRMPEQE
ncbi:hypothetical protein [Mycobacterium sp. 29Ha]|uniref:hypothetical protein n=1 Tax=Mycobacterium sp. 29Ha TaxID=2939268 RepID=UPI002938ECB1|nr:hypothetical protein [Mycobacterium sp. 29Ha]MDV3135324.1 hypothetical protein [Mycobacterium sp. 29Ha]